MDSIPLDLDKLIYFAKEYEKQLDRILKLEGAVGLEPPRRTQVMEKRRSQATQTDIALGNEGTFTACIINLFKIQLMMPLKKRTRDWKRKLSHPKMLMISCLLFLLFLLLNRY